MKKKKIIIISCVAFFAMIASLFLYFSYFSLDITQTYAKITPFGDNEVELRKEYYLQERNIDDDNQYIAENPFPSDDPKDYCKISIKYVAKNRGPFKLSISDGYIVNTEDAGFVIYKRGIVVNTAVDSFSKTLSTDGFDLFCYRNGMTDEEILEKVKKLNFAIYYENDLFNSIKYNFGLENLKLLDDFEEINKTYAN